MKSILIKLDDQLKTDFHKLCVEEEQWKKQEVIMPTIDGEADCVSLVLENTK